MLQNRTAQQEHHYWLPLILLTLALATWCFWLFWGATLTRSALAAQIPHSPATVAATAASAASAAGSDAAATERAAWFTELGQTGDAFGSLNALLTAIAGALVAWAGILQFQSLKEARIALVHSQEEAAAERKHRQRQEFESLFFQLLQLTSKAAEQIEGPRRLKAVGLLTPGKGNAKEYSPGSMGNPGINEFARKVYKMAVASPATGDLDALAQCLVRLSPTGINRPLRSRHKPASTAARLVAA